MTRETNWNGPDDEQKRQRRKRAVMTIGLSEFIRTMSLPVARLAQAVSDDLYQALAYYEAFSPSGSDVELIQRVNSADVNFGFNVISESLHLGCILALCRLWDKPRDSAHIPALARELRHRLERDLDLPCDEAEIQAWLRDVDAASKSEPLRVLRGFRHVGLAHRADPNRPDPRSKQDVRRVAYGDEQKVLEQTIALIDLTR